ncbi:MAG: hypothetical protein R6X33_08660 [Candidatus Brocadiia bacterium]
MGRPPNGDSMAGRAWTRKLWSGLNQWRRKYWRTRVIVLLIIFAPTVGPYLARRDIGIEMNRIACEAILLGSEPRHAWALARFYRAKEVRRLQVNLRTKLDLDRDGAVDGREQDRARALGLDPRELDKRVIHGDLDQLAHAAVRLGVVPSSYSAKDVRLRALHAARNASERFFRPARHEIESIFARGYDWPDYTKWSTWECGVKWFVCGLFEHFGGLGAAAAWLGVCFVVAGGASLVVRDRRPLVGFVVGAGLYAGLLLLARGGHLSGYQTLWGLGYTLLSGVVGYGGGRAAAAVGRRWSVLFGAAILLGLALLVSGTLGLREHAWRLSRAGVQWAELQPEVKSRLVRRAKVSSGIGVGLVVGGIVGAVLLRRRRQRKLRGEVESGEEGEHDHER